MTNKIGIVRGDYIILECLCADYSCKEKGYTPHAVQIPEDKAGVPDGFIAYLDRTGMLQFMDEDPHDYEDRGG